uniref:DNA excision repair protein ERCC-8 n=1 Tax=Plectus sambesii TaxID=2011161 RepID=A0A914VUM5_9BILA
MNISTLLRGRELGGKSQKVRSNPSHSLICSQKVDRTVTQQRLDSLQLSRIRSIERRRNGESVFCLDVDHDQRYLLCGSCDGSVSIVDLDAPTTSKEVACPVVASVARNTRYGHDYMVVSCQWYPFDSGMFVTASSDKMLKVWDTNVMRPVETFPFAERLCHQHWSPVPATNPLIAVAAGTSNIVLIDLRSGSALQQLKWHTATVNTVQWSPTDSNILVSGGADGRVLVWDVRSAKSRLKALSTKAPSGARMKKTHVLINGLRFSQDGLFLLTIGTDQIMRVWDTAKMREKRKAAFAVPTASNFPRKLISFDVTSQGTDGLTVFVPCEDDILVARPLSSARRQLLQGHYNPVNACVYRSNYQQLYSCANDRMVLVWCPEMDERVETPTTNQAVLRDLVEDQWSDDD